MRLPSGRTPLRALDGSGAAPADVPTWDGTRWIPAPPAPGGLVIVQATEPTAPATGQLWYDTDATC